MKSDYYDINITPNKHEYDNAIRIYKVDKMREKRFAFYDFENGDDWGKRMDVEYVNKKWDSFLHEYPEYKTHINPQNYIYEMYHSFDTQFTNDGSLTVKLKCGMFDMMFALHDLDFENAIPLQQAINKLGNKDKLDIAVKRAEERTRLKELENQDMRCEE